MVIGMRDEEGDGRGGGDGKGDLMKVEKQEVKDCEAEEK